MKLIDLLVKELPKRGGWPDGAVECCRHYGTNSIDFYDETGNWDGDCYLKYGKDFAKDCIYEETSGSYLLQSVSRSEYESALAASQKPAWNGDGLPPVGEKVEFFINPKFGYCNGWIPAAGTEMEVVAHKATTDGNDVAVCYWDDGGAGRSCCLVPESLKPLRTEAERKRDAAVEAMQREADNANNWIYSDIYDAIAAGKIPGVKLDD